MLVRPESFHALTYHLVSCSRFIQKHCSWMTSLDFDIGSKRVKLHSHVALHMFFVFHEGDAPVSCEKAAHSVRESALVPVLSHSESII